MGKPLHQKDVLRLFVYDKETGAFYRKAATTKRPAMSRADYKDIHNGYRRVSIAGEKVSAHRVAWAAVYGFIGPHDVIDHIDGDKANNRIDNLRLATRAQNNMNIKAQSRTKSGRKGVQWSSKTKKWHARIGFKRKSISLGYFHSLDDAAKAYASASLSLYGEFTPREIISELAPTAGEDS